MIDLESRLRSLDTVESRPVPSAGTLRERAAGRRRRRRQRQGLAVLAVTMVLLIAGTLSGLAGGLHAPLIMVDPQMGIEVLAFVFMVVIIGGLGSIKGTLISAFIVGQVVSIGSLIYDPLAQMAPFAVMLLILLIKPTGLYGAALVKR